MVDNKFSHPKFGRDKWSCHTRGMFVFDIRNKLNRIIWYIFKKNNRVEFTMKPRSIRQMTELAERHGFEVIKKKNILFLIVMLLLFLRKGRKNENSNYSGYRLD